MASDEIESQSISSSGADSGRDSSCNDVVTPKKGHEFDNINVVVRVRPIDTDQNANPNEKNKETSLFPAAGQISIIDPQSNEQRLFTFNVVFEPEASQLDIFEYSGIKRLIDMALDGFSATVFAYGQTGSGKTYTLSGTMNESNIDKEPTVGLIQLSFAYLFEQIKLKKQLNISYLITASYLEVYNEQVLDLLNPSGKALNVRWNKIRGFYAENLFKVECEDTGDLQGVLEEGMKNRQFRAHEMNEHSSRSHTLLTIAIHCTTDPDDSQNSITRQGRLCLVDLAGSEKTKRTKASKETLVEANRINSSLLALGNCISSLASAKKRNANTHIPFRDSILTKLLKDSLSGSGLTLMIACVSSHYSDAGETISTLRYAARAKKVKTTPVVKIDPRELLILSLRREVRLLSMENNYLRQKINIPISTNLVNELLPAEQKKSINKTEGDKSIESLINNHKESISKQHKNEEEFKNPDKLVAQYMAENKDLRNENAQLHLQSSQLREDLEQMCRENERIKKELKKRAELTNDNTLNKINNFLNTPTNQTNTISSTKNDQLLKDNNETNNKNNLTFKIRKNSVYNIKQSNDKPIRRPSNLPQPNNTITNNVSKGPLELRGISAISQSKIRRG